MDVAGHNAPAPTARLEDVKHHIFLKCLILKVRGGI